MKINKLKAFFIIAIFRHSYSITKKNTFQVFFEVFYWCMFYFLFTRHYVYSEFLLTLQGKRCRNNARG